MDIGISKDKQKKQKQQHPMTLSVEETNDDDESHPVQEETNIENNHHHFQLQHQNSNTPYHFYNNHQLQHYQNKVISQPPPPQTQNSNNNFITHNHQHSITGMNNTSMVPPTQQHPPPRYIKAQNGIEGVNGVDNFGRTSLNVLGRGSKDIIHSYPHHQRGSIEYEESIHVSPHYFQSHHNLFPSNDNFSLHQHNNNNQNNISTSQGKNNTQLNNCENINNSISSSSSSSSTTIKNQINKSNEANSSINQIINNKLVLKANHNNNNNNSTIVNENHHNAGNSTTPSQMNTRSLHSGSPNTFSSISASPQNVNLQNHDFNYMTSEAIYDKPISSYEQNIPIHFTHQHQQQQQQQQQQLQSYQTQPYHISYQFQNNQSNSSFDSPISSPLSTPPQQGINDSPKDDKASRTNSHFYNNNHVNNNIQNPFYIQQTDSGTPSSPLNEIPHNHRKVNKSLANDDEEKSENQPNLVDEALNSSSSNIDGPKFNNRGYEICGYMNQHTKPCQRIGRCPFHAGKKEKSKLKKEANEDPNEVLSSSPISNSNLQDSQDNLSKSTGSSGGVDESPNVPVKKSPFKQGWSRDEHIRFLHGIQLHGRGAWKEIAQVVKSRTPTQIQSHAQKYYLRQQQTTKNKRSIHDLSLSELLQLDDISQQQSSSSSKKQRKSLKSKKNNRKDEDDDDENNVDLNQNNNLERNVDQNNDIKVNEAYFGKMNQYSNLQTQQPPQPQHPPPLSLPIYPPYVSSPELSSHISGSSHSPTLSPSPPTSARNYHLQVYNAYHHYHNGNHGSQLAHPPFLQLGLGQPYGMHVLPPNSQMQYNQHNPQDILYHPHAYPPQTQPHGMPQYMHVVPHHYYHDNYYNNNNNSSNNSNSNNHHHHLSPNS